MGWNAGYKIIEQQVINLYNANKIDKETLEAVISPFRGTDIDSGGSQNLKTHDGKTFEDIVIHILAPNLMREKYFLLKQACIDQKSELAVMNYWDDVKEHFPTKEAYDHASRIHDDFNDIKFEALTKSTGW